MRKDNLGDGQEQQENRHLVQQFEDMMQHNTSCFFDHESFERIIEYYEDRFEFDKALKVVEFALTQYAYSSIFLVKKAQFLFEQQQLPEALELLEKAKILSPNDLEIVLLEAEVLTSLQRYQDAIDELTFVVTLADLTDKTDLLLAIADVYEEWGKENEVFNYLVAALKEKPSNSEILNRFDYCVEVTDRFEESVVIHKQIIDEDPYCYIAWYNLGNAYFGIGLYEKAIDAYEYVTAINEEFEMAYRDCGEAYYELGMYDQAKEQYLDALTYSEPDDELHYNIGLCYYQTQSFKQAVRHFKQAIVINETHGNANFQAGRCFYELRQWEKALTYFSKAIQLDGDNDRYLFVTGSLYFEMENYDMAAVLYHQAIHKNPGEKAFWIALTQTYIALGLEVEAMSIVELAIHEFPEDASILYLKAACLFSFNKKNEGLNIFSQALLTNYDEREIFFDLLTGMNENSDICALIDHYKPQT